jgi:hypothetical protein
MFLPQKFYSLFEKKRKKGKYSVSHDLLKASYYEDLRVTEKKYTKEELVKGRILLFKMVDVMLDELDDLYKKASKKSEINELDTLAKHLRVKRHHRSAFIKKYSKMFDSIKEYRKQIE